MAASSFPALRMRRTRSTAWSRALVAENRLTPSDLIWPLFVTEGEGIEEPIATLPGVSRWSVDRVAERGIEAGRLGIPCLALFPNTPGALRTEDAREALNPDNLICRAIRALKDAAPDVGVLTDVALDPYTAHGHDGIVDEAGYVLNDDTNAILVDQALVQAEAGADIIGSRGLLKGDKKSYQMDPANAQEALREVALDLAEGADTVMVKPGLPYLDIIRRVKDRFEVPVFAYQVSGEYAMIEAAAAAGAGDRDALVLETLMAFKRAGCSGVLTYHAPLAARLLGA